MSNPTELVRTVFCQAKSGNYIAHQSHVTCEVCAKPEGEAPQAEPVAYITTDKRMLFFANRVTGNDHGMTPLYAAATLSPLCGAQHAESGKEAGLTIGEAFKAVGGWMNGGELGYPSFGSMNALLVYTQKMARAALAAQSQGAQAAHADDLAVDRFAAAMKAKMAASRAKGRSGWDDPAQCSTDRLQAMLADHLHKGDPVDVGNFAMMLWSRNERTAAQQAAAPVDCSGTPSSCPDNEGYGCHCSAPGTPEAPADRHPVQPLIEDEHGRARFKENAIVRHLSEGKLNELAALGFPEADWEQCAQLIGYSLDGFGTLSYVTDETYDRAAEQHYAVVDDLRIAAECVLKRWDSPLWRQEVGTAELMGRLRQALASRPAEVDDEGLPPLPDHIEVGGEGWDIEDFKSEKTFTVDHLWQYARYAVVADRAQRGDGWISVDDRMPGKERCLAAYVNAAGKHRIIRAMYAGQFQIDAGEDAIDQGNCEYNEADDTFYLKAGWLECIDNWDDYSSIYVTEGIVTHWRSLPAAPSHTTNKEKGGADGHVLDR